MAKFKIFFYKIYPINNKLVVFWNGITFDGFGDSIKPLYLTMKKLYPEFKYIFIVNNKKQLEVFPVNEKIIKSGSKIYKYLCTAKYYITNMYPLDFDYIKGQLWVSTSQGTQLKTIGFLDKHLTNTQNKERYKIMKKIATLNIKNAQNEF